MHTEGDSKQAGLLADWRNGWIAGKLALANAICASARCFHSYQARSLARSLTLLESFIALATRLSTTQQVVVLVLFIKLLSFTNSL